MSREEFVAMLTTDMPEAPPYFPLDAEMNRLGARSLGEVRAARLDPSDAKRRMHLGATVLDVREAAEFGAQHIPGAINIGLNGQFASWAGTLISARDPLIVSSEQEKQAGEAVMRLARVGFENVAGYVQAGEWDSNRATIRQITVGELRESSLPVLDVRRPGEYESAHVPGAIHIPLNELQRRMGEIPPSPLAVICASGYRSSTAASLLARAGVQDLANVTGGTTAWVRAGFPTESATPRA
jgi:rhodanese-related sulfurtransferase